MLNRLENLILDIFILLGVISYKEKLLENCRFLIELGNESLQQVEDLSQIDARLYSLNQEELEQLHIDFVARNAAFQEFSDKIENKSSSSVRAKYVDEYNSIHARGSILHSRLTETIDKVRQDLHLFYSTMR